MRRAKRLAFLHIRLTLRVTMDLAAGVVLACDAMLAGLDGWVEQ